MKVLFLDIDGVLVTRDSMEREMRKGISPAHEIFDTHAVANLNRVIAETGCKIVISSTWRLLFKWEELLHHCVEHGISREHIIGKTPNLEQRQANGEWVHPERGHEIQEWLNQNPVATRIAILDDDADMAHLLKWLVSLEFKDGLTAQCADATIKMLNKEIQ